MRFLNHFLRRHGVDVGKTIGLLTLAAALCSLYSMVEKVFAGTFHTLDLGAPVEIIVGIGLWNHRPWARKIALAFGWLAVGVFIFIQLVGLRGGNANLTLNIGSETIPQPPEWVVIVLGFLYAPALLLSLAALHSETAREEFTPRPSRFPTPLPNFFYALLITIFLAVAYCGILTLNDAHAGYGQSGYSLYAGSQLTPASNAYYREATRALVNHLSSSGFVATTPLLENDQPEPIPAGTCYLKRKDDLGRTLYLWIDSGLDPNTPSVPRYAIVVGFSYHVKGWSWEKPDFRDTAATWTGEVRQWWLDYRRAHPSGFRDDADPAP